MSAIEEERKKMTLSGHATVHLPKMKIMLNQVKNDQTALTTGMMPYVP